MATSGGTAADRKTPLSRAGVSGGHSDDCTSFWDDSLETKPFFKKTPKTFRQLLGIVETTWAFVSLKRALNVRLHPLKRSLSQRPGLPQCALHA